MDNKTHVHQMGQARGKLMRLEQDLGRAKGNLESATRNRIVGGVILLLGIVALIGFLAKGSQFVGVMAAAGLLVGGLVFAKVQMTIGGTRRSIIALRGGIANAQTKLAELKAE